MESREKSAIHQPTWSQSTEDYDSLRFTSLNPCLSPHINTLHTHKECTGIYLYFTVRRAKLQSNSTPFILFFPLLLRVPSLLRRLSFRDQRARSLSSLSLMCQGTCLQLNSPSEQLGSASQRTVLIPRFSHTDEVSCLSASHVQAQKISMRVCMRSIMEQTHEMKQKVVFRAEIGYTLCVFSPFFYLIFELQL